jgi:hypothetical protein
MFNQKFAFVAWSAILKTAFTLFINIEERASYTNISNAPTPNTTKALFIFLYNILYQQCYYDSTPIRDSIFPNS